MGERRILKSVTQFIAALVYTPIYTSLLYFLVTYPMSWLLTLKPWMIVLIVILGGVTILKYINMFAMAPYMWIVNRNTAAAWAFALLAVSLIGTNTYFIWKECLHQGTMAIVFAVAVTLIFIRALFTDIMFVIYSIDG